MNIFSLLSFSAFIIYMFLGIYAFKAESKTELNRLFFVLCICFSIWAFSYTFVYPDERSAVGLFWEEVSAFGWCLYSGILLHISFILTGRKHILENRIMFAFIYWPGILFLIIHLVLIDHTQLEYFPGFITFVVLHTVYTVCCAGVSLFFIWCWGKKTQVKRESKQANIIFKSGLVTLVLGATVQTIFPVLGVNVIPLMGQITTLILAGGIWYAMVKYKLMNVPSLITVKDIIDKVTDAIIIIDSKARIIDANQKVQKLFGYTKNELVDKPLQVIVDINTVSDFSADGKLSYNEGREMLCKEKRGELIPAKVALTHIKDLANDIVGSVVMIQDTRSLKKLEEEIQERTQKENQLKYLSMHDSLTGLYNRTYFEKVIKKLEKEKCFPLGVMVCDVDGLKLINDTLGHDVGDQILKKAAEALNNSCNDKSIIARIGGDEFVLLFPYCGESVVRQAEEKLREAVLKFNKKRPQILLSMSIGFSISENEFKSVVELFKEADNNMYREKLHHNQSTRSAMVQTLTKTLEARDFITEGHADRMHELAAMLAKDIGLSEREITDLKLLAKFHDIGKVGIPDQILFKQSMLTPEEVTVMQRHSEIGYRIALSAPDLIPIADFVLKHHEKWDGTGYPLGLKKEEIPIECRILSIVDAYDAMVNDRPYRKAMTHETAVLELMRCAGTQFDASLVKRFIALLDGGKYFTQRNLNLIDNTG